MVIAQLKKKCHLKLQFLQENRFINMAIVLFWKVLRMCFFINSKQDILLVNGPFQNWSQRVWPTLS